MHQGQIPYIDVGPNGSGLVYKVEKNEGLVNQKSDVLIQIYELVMMMMMLRWMKWTSKSNRISGCKIQKVVHFTHFDK